MLDPVTHFRIRETGLPIGESEACLTAELLDETPVDGCETVLGSLPCGVGFELGLLLPPLMWLQWSRRVRH